MTNPDTMIEPAPQADAIETTDEQLWQDISDEDAGLTDDQVESADADTPDSFEEEDGEAEDSTVVSDPEELTAQIARLQHSLASEKGRTQASRREIDRLRTEVSAAQNKAQRTPEDEDRLRQSQERLDAAKEEYGDVIGPLAESVEHLTQRFEELSSFEQRDLETKTERLNSLRREQESVFEQEHPDGYDLITREQDSFASWVNDQPANLRQIYARNKAEIVDGHEAAYLVGLFKHSLLNASDDPAHHETNRLKARRERQLDGARATRSTSQQRVAAVPPADSDNVAGHWDYFARLEKQRNG